MHVSANPLHVFMKYARFSPDHILTVPHCAHLFVLTAQFLFAPFDGTSLRALWGADRLWYASTPC